MLKEISKDQALFCRDHGEFEEQILSSSEKVAVFLTQSWCPQWLAMKRFIGDLPDCSIFYLEYDLTDFFDSFCTFKEEVFGNDQVPYIRYYRNGKLTGESNAVSAKEFCSNLQISLPEKLQGKGIDFLPSA
jgi:hypothetical protein